MVAGQDGWTLKRDMVNALHPWPEDQPQDGAKDEADHAIQHVRTLVGSAVMAIPSDAVNNGLPADDWARLEAVPFPLMQQLMVALRGAGIPAYAVADIDESPLRALDRRSPLNQRVYVERAHLEQSRALLAEEMSKHEAAILSAAFDSEFAGLVSQLGANDPRVESAETVEFDSADHFQPPVPDYQWSTDPVTRAAWAGLLGGPLLLLLSLFGVLSLGGMAPGIAVVAFISGFIALVVRMPDRLAVDDGPDDGAVV